LGSKGFLRVNGGHLLKSVETVPTREKPSAWSQKTPSKVTSLEGGPDRECHGARLPRQKNRFGGGEPTKRNNTIAWGWVQSKENFSAVHKPASNLFGLNGRGTGDGNLLKKWWVGERFPRATGGDHHGTSGKRVENGAAVPWGAKGKNWGGERKKVRKWVPKGGGTVVGKWGN